MNELTLVRPECGDWEALYVEGKLVAEGHSLDAMNVIECIAESLGIDYEFKEVPDEIAESGMPESLEDIYGV